MYVKHVYGRCFEKGFIEQKTDIAFQITATKASQAACKNRSVIENRTAFCGPKKLNGRDNCSDSEDIFNNCTMNKQCLEAYIVLDTQTTDLQAFPYVVEVCRDNCVDDESSPEFLSLQGQNRFCNIFYTDKYFDVART